MKLSLADDLLLLVYDDEGLMRASAQAVDYGLAGALLMELMIAGRVTVADKRLVVTDPTPIGDPLADQALARIAADDRGRKPKDWVGPLSDRLRERALDRLVEAGLLRREQDKVLWVFPRTRFPSATGTEPLPEGEARRRLLAAIDGSGPVEPRTAALCALVRAVGIERVAVPDRPVRRVQERIDEIEAVSWPGEAVRKAITEMEAAVTTAVVVATTVTTTS